MAKILVLGAGFSGATVAYLCARKGHKVTVLESNEYPGGGCRTLFYSGHPYTLGPRVFYTRDEEIYKHMVSLVKLRTFYTKTWTYVEADKKLYHYPIQKEDLKLMPDYDVIQKELEERKNKTPSVENFEAYWIDAIGPSLYAKFVDLYSKKMWGVDSNKELVADFKWVNRGRPIRDGDDRLYGDQFQGYPEDINGYNSYFTQSLKDCEVIYNCLIKNIDPSARTVKTSIGEFTGDIIINTIHVDSLFGYQFGELRYCGRDFLKVVIPIEYALPENVTWIHYSGTEPYTRLTEFKKITNYRFPYTLLGIEMPSDRNRLYPIQSPLELKKYERYKTLFPKNFYSIGRLGTFKYKGIEDAISEAIYLANCL